MARRIGIIDETYARPLFTGLGRLFDVTVGPPAELAVALRHRRLEAAFLSPIDYAKDYAMYRIVPGRAASSRGESRAILLAFDKQLRNITTLAVDPRSASEIVLAGILMAEKYGIRPAIVPVAGNPKDALAGKSDAAILAGDRALTADGLQSIDLVDEWSDLTGLPFVHGIWVAREQDLTPEDVAGLIGAGAAAGEGGSGTGAGGFRYDLDADDVAGLSEFFRMAYFHGILNDITDVKFHPDPRPAAG